MSRFALDQLRALRAVQPPRTALARSPLKGRPGNGGGRRWSVVVVAAVAGLMVSAGPAAADGQPAIVKAYGLDWIERVRPEAWPRPKLEAPVICLLDTGVAVTPDTPETNPMGPIVARLSVEAPNTDAPVDPVADAKRGLPQGMSFEHLHGTRMAAIIGAPRNGEGTVGIFPQARIVSVRVTQGEDVFITPADLEVGVRRCRFWAADAQLRIAAVVVAESLYDQRPQELVRWKSAADVAVASGAVLVAAAGNRPDAETVGPLGADSIVTIGAGDDQGGLCAFAAPDGAGDLLGPGCSGGVPVWFDGSSSATAAVGALAAALATRDPSLSADQLRQLLLLTSDANIQGQRRIAGQVVQSQFAGLVATPPVLSPASAETVVARDVPAETDAAPNPTVLLWRPGVQVTWHSGTLRVVRTSRRRAGMLAVRTSGNSVRRVRGTRAKFRLSINPKSVEVWAESLVEGRWRSLSRRVRVRS